MKPEIEARLDELESRLAFQDDALEILNETVARQDRELLRIELQLKTLADKLRDLVESSSVTGESSGHEPPPHY